MSMPSIGRPNRPGVRRDQRPTILLFFGEPERDRLVPGDRHLRHLLRPLYKHLTNRPTTTGFHMAYRNLVTALEAGGYRVRTNDYLAARANPSQPVGIVGYPNILDRWTLPNPAILGPGMFDHPSIRPDLMCDPRFHHYIVPSKWMMDLFAPTYGNACVYWHAGIDTRRWSDQSDQQKDIDVLVYDKIHWGREHFEPELVQPILEQLQSRGLKVEVLRYGFYRYPRWRELLRRSRALLFLSEHETQGLAYQEAMACGLPVLAWDQGWWLDPNRARYTSEPVPTSSVPFFSPECGERFADAVEFEGTLEVFMQRLANSAYRPRAYVERELSLQGSAETYMHYYRALLGSGA